MQCEPRYALHYTEPCAMTADTAIAPNHTTHGLTRPGWGAYRGPTSRHKSERLNQGHVAIR